MASGPRIDRIATKPTYLSAVYEAEVVSTTQPSRELFGLYGPQDRFERVRSLEEFDRLLRGESVTVGVSDPAIGIPGRTALYRSDEGFCVVWGEAFSPSDAEGSVAAWLFDRYGAVGIDAFSEINGSYVAVIEADGEAVVVTDPIRSWECFVAESPRGRVFGTDAAAVARSLPTPTVDRRGLREFVHFGVVLGDRTLVRGVERLPFDAALFERRTESLTRFVYDPRIVDHTGELARRLERAVDRRSGYPRPGGMLMSAGYDSRLLLATLADLDVCYTLGEPDDPEVATARRLCEQYGKRHRTLPVTEAYLDARPEVVRRTNGVRESIHVHHRGSAAGITAPTIYHGLLLDSLLRDHYLPRDQIAVLHKRFPLDRLDARPDVAERFARKLDFAGGDGRLLVRADGPETPEGFLEEAIEAEFDRCLGRSESIHNAMALMGVRLKPALPFRTDLAADHVESLVAADSELLDWHLTTPPEFRNDETYQAALELIDPAIFDHRPPDRPHRSYQLNQLEKFLRRLTPGLEPFATPWPDRDRIYRENDLDRRLFPDRPDLHELSPRTKLRINDARVWLGSVLDDGTSVDELIRSPG